MDIEIRLLCRWNPLNSERYVKTKMAHGKWRLNVTDVCLIDLVWCGLILIPCWSHWNLFPSFCYFLDIQWYLVLITLHSVTKVFFVSISSSQSKGSEVNDGNHEIYNPVVCEAEDSFMCSLALDAATSFVAMVTVSISDAVAPPILLKVPARPGRRRISFFFTLFFFLYYSNILQFVFP